MTPFLYGTIAGIIAGILGAVAQQKFLDWRCWVVLIGSCGLYHFGKFVGSL